ncbi:MAG TPA: DMT family transporter [Burkholderiales bacterium]|nr:DMT family transporter [Burkholderiales bacterium]
MGITLALASMLCFAANIMVSRSALARVPIELGFLVVLVVNVLLGGALFGIDLLLRRAPFAIRWEQAGWFALAGIVGTYLGRRMLYDTIRVLGPARSSVFHSSSPVFTLVAAWVLVGERLGGYELGLMALVISGLWITQLGAGAATAHRPAGETLRRGALYGVLTVSGFGVGNAIRGLAMRGWNEPVFGTLLGASTALVAQLATTRDLPRKLAGLRRADRGGLALYAASGVVTVLGQMFLLAAMRRMPIALAALVSMTTPLVIFPLSLLAYRNREGLTRYSALGAGMVLAGIALLALR